jgi:hypothetical protein
LAPHWKTSTQTCCGRLGQRQILAELPCRQAESQRIDRKSSDTQSGDTAKGQHWFNALLKYKLKPFALTQDPPAWIFEVTADGYLARTSIQDRSPHERAVSTPPWREEPSSASSSGSAPWRERMPKKQRITE